MNADTQTTVNSRSGTCTICGAKGNFTYDGQDVGLREKLLCPDCHSHSRYRSLARGILRYFSEELGVEVPSLKALINQKLPKDVAIYDCQPPFYYENLGYTIPTVLSQHPQIKYFYSKLDKKFPLGHTFSENFSNQNLESLSFADGKFDIVLTSDVLEHVRNDDYAHKEIARVLQPRGVHIFTVPHCYQWPQTLTKVIVHDPNDPAKDEIIGEPEYHGDVNSVEDRALAYRVYGHDIHDKIGKYKMDLRYEWSQIPENVIFDTELFYAQKK